MPEAFPAQQPEAPDREKRWVTQYLNSNDFLSLQATEAITLGKSAWIEEPLVGDTVMVVDGSDRTRYLKAEVTGCSETEITLKKL